MQALCSVLVISSHLYRCQGFEQSVLFAKLEDDFDHTTRHTVLLRSTSRALQPTTFGERSTAAGMNKGSLCCFDLQRHSAMGLHRQKVC